MPSTSVQITIFSAPSPAPTIAAEKSDPPRPIVVVIPVRVDAMNPPITETRPLSINGRTNSVSLRLVSSNSGAARVKVSSVTMQSRESTRLAPMPCADSAAVTSLLESTSPNDAT